MERLAHVHARQVPDLIPGRVGPGHQGADPGRGLVPGLAHAVVELQPEIAGLAGIREGQARRLPGIGRVRLPQAERVLSEAVRAVEDAARLI